MLAFRKRDGRQKQENHLNPRTGLPGLHKWNLLSETRWKVYAGPEFVLRLPHGIQDMQAHTRMHMCTQKDNARSFRWHETEECLPFFTVGNKYMKSWCQCKIKYCPRGLVLKKSCVRHMEYLLLLIDFQVKSSLVFVYSWPQVRNVNYWFKLLVVQGS